MSGSPMLTQIDVAHPKKIADRSKHNRKFLPRWWRFPGMDDIISMFHSFLNLTYEFPWRHYRSSIDAPCLHLQSW